MTTVFKALSDDTRRQILKLLANGDMTAKEISENTTHQGNSIRQTSREVDEISSVVHNNAASAEECAAASEQLSGQATQLKDLVGQFKLSPHAKTRHI